MTLDFDKDEVYYKPIGWYREEVEALLRVARAAEKCIEPTDDPLPDGWEDDWKELEDALAALPEGLLV
jgi:hypothetical protein